MPNLKFLAQTTQKLCFLTEFQNGDRRPCWILIFVYFRNSAVFPSWISKTLPNLKFRAQTVENLWPFNLNQKWWPVAILDIDFCQF